MAERYMYIPVAGLCLVAGESLGHLYSRCSAKQLAWIVTCVIVITLAAWTVKRNMEWKDDISLFKSAIKSDPASVVGHFNLGNAHLDRSDLAAARLEWLKTLEIDPGYSDALTQMGTLAATQGDLMKAEKYYLAALQSPPGMSDPDKAMVHYNLGKIYDKQDRPVQALKHYELFLKQVPVYYAEYKPLAEERVAQLRALAFSNSK